ncbi:hypothetical protein [Shewanella surugensis]|uniref:Uncharacterized protein n=1 Tax=Shewanella surugensis TaxID=212020 RepID=A0ABT0L5Y4_9GAMM|nr:hypothetical protein [Shewanella surugensis]MCL1123086.1 hypothetical protein [Shewanella surugensis]
MKSVCWFLIFVPFNIMAKDCQLPANLSSWRIILEIDQFYQPSNPKAGGLQELTFTASTVKDVSLETRELNQGAFQYKLLAPEVAVLISTLTQGPEPSQSKIIFACDTSLTGKYIFTQTHGELKPNVRQNTGSYIITNRKNNP